uniref:Predicted protein n=1 Tax=Hordeum vulgare subsp. vulgare TaxID=112509 RepID=F2E3R4_HORVV|nr:predicted protein [Hordeum vulgare subsp. vulgare]
MGAPTPLPRQPLATQALNPSRPPTPRASRRAGEEEVPVRRRGPSRVPGIGNGLGASKPQPQRCILDMFPYPRP